MATESELRAQLVKITKWRREELDRLNEQMARVNRAFDVQALEIGRELKQYEPEPEPKKEEPSQPLKRKRRQSKPLTIEEMRESLERRGKL